MKWIEIAINAFHQLLKSMRVYGKIVSCNHSCCVMLCLSKPLAFVFSGVLLIQRSFLGMWFTSIPQSQTPLDRRLCSFLAPLHLLSQPPLLAVAPPLVPALAPLLAPLLAPDIEDPLHCMWSVSVSFVYCTADLPWQYTVLNLCNVFPTFDLLLVHLGTCSSSCLSTSIWQNSAAVNCHISSWPSVALPSHLPSRFYPPR